MHPEILIVVIEYSVAQQRVMVRGVFCENDLIPALVAPENTQNIVKVFKSHDMGANVGISGLVPSELVHNDTNKVLAYTDTNSPQ